MSKDDLESFKNQMSDVMPLEVNRVNLHQKKVVTLGMEARRKAAQQKITMLVDDSVTEDVFDQVEPRDILKYQHKDSDNGVFKKLCQGKLSHQAVVDLHHMTVLQAKTELTSCIDDCVLDGFTVLLVIHGRGEGREKPALLKSWTNYWLKNISSVIGFHSAQSRNGGTGATCVLLSKISPSSQ